MNFDKGLLVLDFLDLELASKCPGSLLRADLAKSSDWCTRCLAFAQIAKYCFNRAFRKTNLPSIKTLSSQYCDILLDLNRTDLNNREFLRQDLGILGDILELSKKYQEKIDFVNPEVNLNFGQFVIRDNLDLILFDNNEYSIVKFLCGEETAMGYNYLSYEMIAGSLWLRKNYNVDINSITVVEFNKNAEPIIYPIDIKYLSTNYLQSSIQSIIQSLNISDIKENKLRTLPVRFGTHCQACMHCFTEN